MLEQQNTKRTRKGQFYFLQKMISTWKENPEAQAGKGLHELGGYPRSEGQSHSQPTAPLHRPPLWCERADQTTVLANMKSRREAPGRVLSSPTLSICFQFHLSSPLPSQIAFLKSAISKHLLNICSVPKP